VSGVPFSFGLELQDERDELKLICLVYEKEDHQEHLRKELHNPKRFGWD